MLHVTSMRGTTPTLQRADLNDQVYARLKEQLSTRNLEPGEKLSLQELASAFGVSRSPVQHALTRLVSEGLVDVRPHHGHFVRPLTEKLLCDAYDVREALELHAAEHTAGRLSPAELAELRRLMERTLKMVDGRRLVDRRGYIATNQAFHEHMIGLAGNEPLLESYRRLSVNVLMERVLSGATDSGGNVAAEHREIVAGYEAGDLDRVGAAIRAHVETGKVLARAAIERAGGVL
jgi:DNA-binding GntR family transcriptional regulator